MALPQHAAALARRAYVVTRNSHKAEIASFLAQRGVACDGVLVVRKGHSKAEAMLAVLPGLARHGADREASRALFVDDSVRECCDERVASLPGLYRVCFRRGAVL